jgi:hypothetical protein
VILAPLAVMTVREIFDGRTEDDKSITR